jgi:DNA repair exonuclease SbcCD ATPase subunit
MIYILPGIIFILAGVIFAFLQISWGTLVAGALAALIFVLTILHYRSRLQKSDETDEVSRIFQAYEAKFGQKALSITDLKSKHTELKPKYYGLDQIKADLTACQEEFADLQKELDMKLSVFFKQIPELENVDAQISDLQNKRKGLVEDYQQEKYTLGVLGVDPEDYLSDPVDTQFDQKRFNQLTEQRDELGDSIEDKEQSLQNLKQRVCDLTGSSISSPWDVIIDQLRDHRDDVSQSMKDSKAKIGSGLVIAQVINEIREREDEGIAKALASNAIRAPIKALTQAYQGVEMEGDDIYVFSEYERFPVHHFKHRRTGTGSFGIENWVSIALSQGSADVPDPG